MRNVTVYLDDARRAVLPMHAVWVVDVELEQDGTVMQETWRRVGDGEAAQRLARLAERVLSKPGSLRQRKAQKLS
jgi:hypothetical protein